MDKIVSLGMLAGLGCLLGLPQPLISGEDWYQWRGPHRTGYISNSVTLIKELPAAGLEPAWTSGQIDSARDGGWGSPIVADGVVYLFSHKKELVGDPPGPRKFPYLAPEKRGNMTDEEFAEYEKNRRNEDEQRAKAYRYREFIMAYDARTGEERWVNQSQSTYTRFPQSGCPTVVGDRLFIQGAGRMARCLDTKSGVEVWSTKLPGEFRDEFYQASVLLVDGVAVFNATHLFGLDSQDGRIIWAGDNQRTAGTHASPVVWEHAGRKYVLSIASGGNIVCVYPQTGEVQWTTPAEGGHASPIVQGDRLLVYGNSRKKGLHCYRLTPQGAESLWIYQRVTDKGSTPVVTENAVYVQGERKLARVNLETGQQIWMTDMAMENPQYSSPIAAGDLGFYAYDGLIAFELGTDSFTPIFEGQIDQDNLLASSSSFREKYRLDEDGLDAEERKKLLRDYQQQVGRHGPLKCSSPAFADGFLYIRLRDSLACYDLRAK